MAKVSPTDWFKIQGWMATEFDLTMGELVAFALVHTFTRPKEGKVYTGGVPYLAKFARCSTSSARRYLQSLVSKGLIKAVEGTNNGVPFIHYYTLSDRKGTPSQIERVHPAKLEGTTLSNCEGKQNNKQKGKHKLFRKIDKKKDFSLRLIAEVKQQQNGQG